MPHAKTTRRPRTQRTRDETKRSGHWRTRPADGGPVEGPGQPTAAGIAPGVADRRAHGSPSRQQMLQSAGLELVAATWPRAAPVRASGRRRTPRRRGVRDRPERQACPGAAGCPGPLHGCRPAGRRRCPSAGLRRAPGTGKRAEHHRGTRHAPLVSAMGSYSHADVRARTFYRRLALNRLAAEMPRDQSINILDDFLISFFPIELTFRFGI